MRRPLILLLVFVMIILNGMVFDVLKTDGHGHGKDNGDNQIQVEMEH